MSDTEHLSEQIADGERIGAFLADPAVERAFRGYDQACFQAFKNATSEDQRTVTWARVRAAEDLIVAFNAIRDRGLAAKIELARAEKAADLAAEQAARTARRTR